MRTAGNGKGRLRLYFAAGMAVIAACVLASCRQMPGDGEKKQETVEIPIIFQVDPASSHRSNEELVEAFNKEYEGQYQVRVQWMFDTTSAYRSQIKVLNAVDELPAVLTDLAFSPAFFQLLIDEGRLVDLAPFMAEDEQWQGWMDENVLAPCYEEDGALYIMPISSNCFSYSGIFYNKELFARAGIEKFPEGWEQFWQCCEQLEKKGITPLALHTKGTAWAPMLLATSYIGASKAGGDFLNRKLPECYDGYGEQMASVLKQAFRYTTEDAVGKDFDVAFGHFIKEEAAMLPNGYWMNGQLDGELAEKIGFAPMPGNVMVVSPQMSGWSVAAGYPPKVREAAVEFLRFRSRSTRLQADEMMSGSRAPENGVEQDYLAAMKQVSKTVANYQIHWNPILQEQVLPDAIGKLVAGEIGEQEFTGMLNDSVKQFEKEQ